MGIFVICSLIELSAISGPVHSALEPVLVRFNGLPKPLDGAGDIISNIRTVPRDPLFGIPEIPEHFVPFRPHELGPD